MVHRRAFSFTDDSTNVALPKLSSSTVIPEHSAESTHPATELIRLREAASMSYHSLFQSGPDVLHDPWPTLCSAHLALDEWERDLCRMNLQEAHKSLFRSEILYIKIVLLSPSRLSCPLEDYGQLLIFEHALRYTQIISSLVEDRANAAACTSYDLLRTIFVAQRFVEVLARHGELCFSDLVPPVPRASASALTDLPCLSTLAGRERLSLGVTTFSMLDIAIQNLGRRYGIPSAWAEFKPQFDGVYASLDARWMSVENLRTI
ncbi:MAG: hypothetical protein Q9225_005120 [Loekoesia sp. 1 TL-2023]